MLGQAGQKRSAAEMDAIIIPDSDGDDDPPSTSTSTPGSGTTTPTSNTILISTKMLPSMKFKKIFVKLNQLEEQVPLLRQAIQTGHLVPLHTEAWRAMSEDIRIGTIIKGAALEYAERGIVAGQRGVDSKKKNALPKKKKKKKKKYLIILDLDVPEMAEGMPHSQILSQLAQGLARLGRPADPHAVAIFKGHVRIWDEESTVAHFDGVLPMRRLLWRLAVDATTGEVLMNVPAGTLRILVDRTWVEVEMRSGQAVLFGNPSGKKGGSFGHFYYHQGVGQAEDGVRFVTVVADTMTTAPHGPISPQEVQEVVARAMECLPTAMPPKPANYDAVGFPCASPGRTFVAHSPADAGRSSFWTKWLDPGQEDARMAHMAKMQPLGTVAAAKANATLSERTHELIDIGLTKLGGKRAPKGHWVKQAGGDVQLGRQLSNNAHQARTELVGNAPKCKLLDFCSEELLDGALAGAGPTCREKVTCVLDALGELNQVQSSQNLREQVAAAHTPGQPGYVSVYNKIRHHLGLVRRTVVVGSKRQS